MMSASITHERAGGGGNTSDAREGVFMYPTLKNTNLLIFVLLAHFNEVLPKIYVNWSQ